MPKPAITTFSGVSVEQSPTNINNGLGAPELTQAQIDAIPDAKNGVFVYNTDTKTVDVVINDVWTELGTGGDVDGPAGAVDNNIVTFDGTTGLILKDSGVNINDLQDVVTGPIDSIDNNIAIFSGTSGKVIEDSGVSITEVLTPSPSETFASELYLSTASNYIEDAVAQSGHEFAWSSSLKLLLRSCIVGGGASSTTDGVNWLDVVAFPFASGCIAWSDEEAQFSGVQIGGTGYTSSGDGVTWAVVQNTTGVFDAGSVLYSPVSNRFYSGTDEVNNRIYSSLNGAFYEANTSNREAREFAFGNGVTVAIGSNGPQYITAAAAGSLTWTNSTATFSAESVAFSEELGYFVAVPRGGVLTNVFTSVDGINWTTHTNAFNTTDDKRFILWIPALSMFLAGGDSEYLGISKDGLTFKQVADFTIATGTDTYQGIYIDEWGELIMGRNALSVTRTAKRFIY